MPSHFSSHAQPGPSGGRFARVASIGRVSKAAARPQWSCDDGDMNETYTHGHHESVLRSHEWRTAENSAGYLLDRLEPGMDLLDVGCGPGTITLDLARGSRRARWSASTASDDVIAQADALRAARRASTNVTFATGDVYALDFADASFDVVHAHQVLQHLQRSGRRAARAAAGAAARRDRSPSATATTPRSSWAPDDPLLDRWNELYHAVTAHNGAEADAGRYLLGWVQDGRVHRCRGAAARRGRSPTRSGASGGGACGPTGSSSRGSPSRRSSTG